MKNYVKLQGYKKLEYYCCILMLYTNFGSIGAFAMDLV